MLTQPFSYQEEDIRRIEEFNGRCLLGLEMGLGKSLESLVYCLDHPNLRPVVVVCPKSLKYNWEKEARIHVGLKAVVLEHAKPPGKNIPYQGDIYVINYDILGGWLSVLKKIKPKIVIADECFPFNTPVLTDRGWLHIGEIVENQLEISIASYSFAKKRVEFKPITHYIKNRIGSLRMVKVSHENGSLTCTENHKIWTENRGYVQAIELRSGDKLRLVRGKISGGEEKKILQQHLLWKLVEGANPSKQIPLRVVPKRNSNERIIHKKILLSVVRMFMEDDSTRNTRKSVHKRNCRKNKKRDCRISKIRKSKIRFFKQIQKNDRKQSSPHGWCGGKNITNQRTEREFACLDWQTWGEWENYQTRKNIVRSIRRKLEIPTSSSYASKSRIRISNMLQNRCWKSTIHVGNRNRWERSQKFEFPNKRSKKTNVFRISRVENVKVLESRNRQRSDECFEQNQFVYCLEIADNHNFFADGVLVSNCQYIRAIKGVKRVKYFKELCQGVPHVLALSGTPLVNRPAELWNVINLLRPDVFDSWVDFAPRYCAPRLTRWGLVYDGAENLDELNQRLVSSCMIRRLKSEVLTDLPPKSRFVVPLPLEKPKEYQLAKTDFLKWLAQVNPKKVKRAKRALALVKLNYLLQLAAKLKLNSVFEWIDNFLEDSVGKILLFCTHKNTLDLLVDRYKDQCVFIDGSVSGTKRQLAVDQFQNNKKTRVFVGNVVAAGTGLTLTAASTVAFVELDWVPANMTQCEDRVHRIGQKNNVQIYYLVAHNTIEEKLCEILQDKQKVLDAVLDGKIDGSGTLDVYDELERELHRSFSV